MHLHGIPDRFRSPRGSWICQRHESREQQSNLIPQQGKHIIKLPQGTHWYPQLSSSSSSSSSHFSNNFYYLDHLGSPFTFSFLRLAHFNRLFLVHRSVQTLLEVCDLFRAIGLWQIKGMKTPLSASPSQLKHRVLVDILAPGTEITHQSSGSNRSKGGT